MTPCLHKSVSDSKGSSHRNHEGLNFFFRIKVSLFSPAGKNVNIQRACFSKESICPFYYRGKGESLLRYLSFWMVRRLTGLWLCLLYTFIFVPKGALHSNQLVRPGTETCQKKGALTGITGRVRASDVFCFHRWPCNYVKELLSYWSFLSMLRKTTMTHSEDKVHCVIRLKIQTQIQVRCVFLFFLSSLFYNLGKGTGKGIGKPRYKHRSENLTHSSRLPFLQRYSLWNFARGLKRPA